MTTQASRRRDDQDEATETAELTEHLARTSRLDPGEARKLVEEVVAYFSETLDEFVVRRHRELQREQLRNETIYARIAEEARARRFASPPLTERQIRRLIYG